ncbi:MAG: hypothetical protein NC548_47390 [Lachnospiraceae bacterium]|nr:hypothetical protein [Lachnospiraceae bacterium]
MIIRVSKHGIYAMSEPIHTLYKKMDDNQKNIHRHVAKCILWGKDYKDYDHWICDEIATWIDQIARRKAKAKLKSSAVQEHLFDMVGDEYTDALIDLDDVYDECRRKLPPYPEVEITRNLSIRFFNAYHEIEKYFTWYICNHKFTKHSGESYKDEIIPKLYEILDKYC